MPGAAVQPLDLLLPPPAIGPGGAGAAAQGVGRRQSALRLPAAARPAAAGRLAGKP